jgi:hypothetical protein
LRRIGRLRVEFGRHHTGLCLAGRLSELHLPAASARGSSDLDQGGDVVGAQDKQRTNDGVATAAAIVIFWPAAFFVGGDKQTAAELAQMKGQMVAVEQASIAKKCNIQFQGPTSARHLIG